MFPGLTDRDFDAYAPQKWRSNAFTRDRQEVKQKLVGLGRGLAGSLVSSDGAPLLLEASAEQPALANHHQVSGQHAYFSRNEGARKELDAIIDRGRTMAAIIDDPTPQHSHIFLALSVTQAMADVSLKLHPDAKVDRQNLERKCEDFFEREKLLVLLRGLGDGFQVGRVPTDPAARTESLLPAATLSEEQLVGVLADTAAGALWFYAGLRVMREDARVGAGFGDLAREALGKLLPIYQFIAWTRDNDFVSIRDQLKQTQQAKRQKNLVRNDRVRIVRGVLSGKTGVVQAIDAKGQTKVLVGKVAIKLDADDLVKA
jgi:hypothetical protein